MGIGHAHQQFALTWQNEKSDQHALEIICGESDNDTIYQLIAKISN